MRDDPPAILVVPVALGLLLVLLAATSCTSGATGADLAPGPGPTVRRGDLEDRFLLTGELQAVRSEHLTTPRTRNWNLTIQWMEREGSRVHAGDPVVEFDTSSVTSTLEDKRLAAAEAEKELQRLRVDQEVQRQEKLLDLRKKELARDRAALDAAVPEGLQSRHDHQEKQLARERAQAEVDKARRDQEAFEQGAEAQVKVQELNLTKARRDLQRAEGELEALTLRAPVDGVLLHGTHPWEGRKWQNGDSTWPGLTVAEVPDLSEMEVIAWLSDVDDGEIAVGMPARAVLDTYPGRPFPARIAEITEVAEEPDRESSRRFFRVRVALDEIDTEMMRPGMSAKVEVIRHAWSDVAVVPRASLALSAGDPRLRLGNGQEIAVALLGCGAAECALAGGPPEGTSLGSAP